LTFFKEGIISIGAHFLSIAERFPLYGGKNTALYISPEVSVIFSIICGIVLIWRGSEVVEAKQHADYLYGIFREMALDGLNRKKRALFLPGFGCCIGAILCLISYYSPSL
jgi:hypothetical protein